MLKAPVDAIPPLAGKGVVPCSPAPGKISPWPGPTDPLPLTSMPAVLIVLLTKFTKLLAPKVLPAVHDATPQLAPLVLSLMLSAYSRPPPKSRGLLVNWYWVTLVYRQSAVWGPSVAVRVDHGGRGIMNNK